MTWTKLSDDFADDCETLSDAAFRLHVEGLGWSNRKLLDCTIPRDNLRRFATHPDAVEELLAAGWWTLSEDGAAYIIRHHATYQQTREQVLRRQATSAANGRLGGRPKKPRERVETQQVTQSLTHGGTQGDGTGRDGKGSPTEHAGSGAQSDPALAVVEPIAKGSTGDVWPDWPEVREDLRTPAALRRAAGDA